MNREIGTTGVMTYPVGWGPMPLSTRAKRPDAASALAVFKAALDAGVTLWDTANAYCWDDGDIGHNERLIATAIAKLGIAGEVQVASKWGQMGGAGNPAHRARF